MFLQFIIRVLLENKNIVMFFKLKNKYNIFIKLINSKEKFIFLKPLESKEKQFLYHKFQSFIFE